MLVARPQRVVGDVAHEHRRTPERRRAAAPRLRPDRRPVNRVDVFRRQRRRRAVPQVRAVRVQQQDGDLQLPRLRLEAAQQGVQRVLQRLPARDHLQRLVLQPRQGVRRLQLLHLARLPEQDVPQDEKQHQAGERHERPALVGFQLHQPLLLRDELRQQLVGI